MTVYYIIHRLGTWRIVLASLNCNIYYLYLQITCRINTNKCTIINENIIKKNK